MKLITFEEIEYSILIDAWNDITIFSFYERQPDIEGIYHIAFKHIYGIDYSDTELLEVIKTFNN